MDDASRLRPQSVIELVDAAFRLYRQHFLTFIGIAAIVHVPLVVLRFLLEYVVGRDAALDVIRFSSQVTVARPGQNPFADFPVSSFLIFFGITLGVVAFEGLVVQSVIGGALANAVSHSILSKPISILAAYSFGLRRYGSLMLASLILVVIGAGIFMLSLGCAFSAATLTAAVYLMAGSDAPQSILGSMLLIGFVIILALGILCFLTRFFLAIQAIVLEGYGTVTGLGRSWRLIRNSFPRVLGTSALALLLSCLASLIPSYLVNYGLSLISSHTAQDVFRNRALGAFVAEVGLIISLPVFFSIYTLLYYDLRIRKEGYDLEIMVQQAALP